MNAIIASGVVKRFGARAALGGVDLTVAAGEVVAIIGPSGSGKSTLLRCLAGLEPIDAGRIDIAGISAPPVKDLTAALQGRAGFVFQNFNLFPHLTAVQNVMEAPLRVKKTPKPEARAKALALLEKVGLGGHADAYPASLSGGQAQRCAIARALAMDPEVMLFDEPTSALDPELVAEVLGVIGGLAQEGRTLVIVTHQMNFARDVAGRTLFMDAGAVVEQGESQALFERPQTERLQRFLSGAVL